MTRKTSIRDVAKRAKVSPAAVSRVINGWPGLAEDTQQRIRKAIRDTGYQPDARLQRFFKTVQRGSRTIGFLGSAHILQRALSADGFYSRILAAIHQEARMLGFHLLLVDPKLDVTPTGQLRCVAEGVVDGLVAEWHDSEWLGTIAARVPLVLVNCEHRLPAVDVVLPDVERAAIEQVDYLVRLGHRQIACFKVRPGSWQDARFWRGYETACRQRRLALPEAYLLPIRFGLDEHPKAIAEFLDRLLDSPAPPSAILTYDGYAAELMRQLAARGLRVPGDMSIVGYDDFQCRDTAPIPLATYRQNFEGMARVAVQLLAKRMRDRTAPAQTIEVAGTHVERASACAPRNNGAKVSLVVVGKETPLSQGLSMEH